MPTLMSGDLQQYLFDLADARSMNPKPKVAVIRVMHNRIGYTYYFVVHDGDFYARSSWQSAMEFAERVASEAS